MNQENQIPTQPDNSLLPIPCSQPLTVIGPDYQNITDGAFLVSDGSQTAWKSKRQIAYDQYLKQNPQNCKDLSKQQIESLISLQDAWQELYKRTLLLNWTIKQEVGVCIVNDYAVSKIQISD